MSDLILLANISLSLITFSLIARWYGVPLLRRLSWEQALEPLLLLHTLRHIGLMFLASGAVKSPLPPTFADPAAFGDLVAAVLAFVAIFSLHARKRWAVVFVWTFNIEGSLDLAYALAQGVTNSAASAMGAAFWIPAILVPALLVSHALVFWLLLQRQPIESVRSRAAT